MWLTRVSINNPVFAAMIMLALMVIGLLATFRMKVEEFPNIEFPFVVVNTVYSGASPEVIETDITKKIEDQVNTIAGVKEVTSVTQQGLSQVIVQFDLNIPSDVAAQNVRDKLALVTPTFRDERLSLRSIILPMRLWCPSRFALTKCRFGSYPLI